MAYICEDCHLIGNKDFCFKRKKGLSRQRFTVAWPEGRKMDTYPSTDEPFLFLDSVARI